MRRSLAVLFSLFMLATTCFGQANNTPQDVEATCMKNYRQFSLYGCACLAKAYEEAHGHAGTLTPAMLAKCPAEKAATAKYVEVSCTDYYRNTRSDSAQLCACTADKFSTSWHARPGVSVREYESRRADFLKACGATDRSHNIK